MRARDSYTRPPEVILKLRFSEMTGTTLWLLLAFVLAIPIILVAYIIVVCYPDGDVTEWSSWEPALSAFWRQLSEQFSVGSLIQAALMLVVSVPVLYAVAVIMPKQRLIVSEGTLRWHVPLPPWLGFVKLDWALNLSEISRASLKSAPFGPEAGVVLQLETNDRTRQLPPALWVEESAPTEQPSLMNSWRVMRKRPNRGHLLDTPLCAALLNAGVAIEGLEATTRPGEGFAFDLNTNEATRLIAGVILSAMVYGVLDTMFSPEEYVTGPPLRWLIGTGCLAAAFGFVYLLNNEIPLLVALALACLLGFTATGASWPGILRINAATDSRGLQTVIYYRDTGNRFEPAEGSDWPAISLPEPGYWNSQADGIERSIRIRRGGLGIYQVRLDNIKAELRDYFRSQ